MKHRFRDFAFWDGAVFGMFVCVEITLVTIWLFDVLGTEYWVVISRFIAVPTALLGAIIAFSITRYQISHSQNRDLAASRALLPLALSELVSVARNGILISADLHPETPQNSTEIANLLRVSPETITMRSQHN